MHRSPGRPGFQKKRLVYQAGHSLGQLDAGVSKLRAARVGHLAYRDS